MTRFAGTRCRPAWIAGFLVVAAALAVSANQEDKKPSSLAFAPAGPGEFTFDTGVLRGKLRPGGKSRGLSSVVHTSTGAALDRGDTGYGLFSHYRVFSSGQRYGAGAWDWPSQSRLLEDGAVEVAWPAAADRPFEMRATYRWSAPDTLDLETGVKPQRALPGFEVFLASYFTGDFDRSLACVADPPQGSGKPGFMEAEKAGGIWQAFPRDAAAAAIIGDGRWKLPPHPVSWTIMPALAHPMAVRRSPKSGIAAAMMGAPDECFAVSMPHQTEGHYSVYLSLFGRDLKEGEAARARTRLVIGVGRTDDQVLDLYRPYRSWIQSGR
jgi:hypothetical protein